MNQQKGLSLIELLVVIALLGIVAVMTVSVGRSAIQRAGMSNTINKFISDVSKMKQIAARENRYMVIEFNNDGRSYSLKKQRTIGDLNNWDDAYSGASNRVSPSGEKVFFDTSVLPISSRKGIAFKSTGEVYLYPIPTNPTPAAQEFHFFMSKGTLRDYKRKVTLFPTGGVKVENEQ